MKYTLNNIFVKVGQTGIKNETYLAKSLEGLKT